MTVIVTQEGHLLNKEVLVCLNALNN